MSRSKGYKTWRLMVVVFVAKIFRIKFKYNGFPFGAKSDPVMERLWPADEIKKFEH